MQKKKKRFGASNVIHQTWEEFECIDFECLNKAQANWGPERGNVSFRHFWNKQRQIRDLLPIQQCNVLSSAPQGGLGACHKKESCHMIKDRFFSIRAVLANIFRRNYCIDYFAGNFPSLPVVQNWPCWEPTKSANPHLSPAVTVSFTPVAKKCTQSITVSDNCTIKCLLFETKKKIPIGLDHRQQHHSPISEWTRYLVS